MEIIVNIGRDGQVEFDVNGVKGSSCQGLTDSLQEALGKTTGSALKKEFYEKEENSRIHTRG
jgi:hypothetical protein